MNYIFVHLLENKVFWSLLMHGTNMKIIGKVAENYDASNQQDATNSVYWSFYWSIWICSTYFGWQTLPSSGALLTVYTALVHTMHLCCCRPVGALYTKSCVYSQKCSWRWASLSPETCRAVSNRSIKRSIKENFCILLAAYIVVLMM